MSSEQSTKLASVDRTSERTFRIERDFAAPRERVWKAFTDPELVAQWWGPRKYETVVEELDARPGGNWAFVHRGADGEEHRFRGIYREVEAPGRLTQTFEWLGMPGYVMLEEATLEDRGDSTHLIVDCYSFKREEVDGMLESGMEEGMQETYQRLDELIAAGVA